jgi:4-amino-4-deoxy-L-arabinose transferase-like glycosyltransferase
LFAFLTPVFQAPDEPSHLLYVNYLARQRRLPNQNVARDSVPGEGNQPPLYYALAAAITSAVKSGGGVEIHAEAYSKQHWWKELSDPDSTFASPQDRRAFYAIRVFSVGLGALTIVFVNLLAGMFFKDSLYGLLPGVLVATLPQFAFLSGALSNDNLANALCAASFYFMFRVLDNPAALRHYFWLGLCLGLALLAKKTALFLAPGLLLAFCYLLMSRREQSRSILQGAGLTVLMIVAVAGWMLVRNLRLYGDPLATHLERTMFADMLNERNLFSPYFWNEFPQDLFRSFIGLFAWMNIPLPEPIYAFYGSLAIFSFLGLLIHFKRERWNDVPGHFAIIFVLSCLAAVVHFNLQFTQPQGRYLFPALAVIAMLSTHGLAVFFQSQKRVRYRGAMLWGLIAALVVVDLISLAVFHQAYLTPN